jgi:Fe-S-cluster containining protein
MNIFKCRKCGSCCKNGIVILYPEDINRISNYLSLTKIDFINYYYVKEKIIDLGGLKVLYLDNSKECIFLDQDNLCSIHSVKPLQCIFGPQKYFNSINTWKNCIQLSGLDYNPFLTQDIPDEFFVKKLIQGYDLVN